MHVPVPVVLPFALAATLLAAAPGRALASSCHEEKTPSAASDDHGGAAHAAKADGHHAHGDAHAAAVQGAGIPESLKVDHAELHETLVRATRLRGPVGDAARGLAKALHAHFVREEEIALPPLGLLAPLAKGKPTPEMKAVLELTDALRAELPRMLEEHVAIAAAARNLEAAARAGKNREVEQFARKLQVHARSEEQVFYPAALVVGDVVRAGLASADAAAAR